MFNFICRSLPHLRANNSFATSSLFSRSLSPYPAPISSNQHSFTVTYLINSCGLSPEKALSISKYMKFKTPNRADSVLAFFKNHGFTKTQVSNLVTSSIGFSNTDLVTFLTARPKILSRSLQNNIIPSFNFLRSQFRSDEKTVTAIKRSDALLNWAFKRNVYPNFRILQEAGVPGSKIVSLLTHMPRDLMFSTGKFKRLVEEVKEMGFNPLKMTFVLAIHALGSMSKSTWEKKMELYKKLGWCEDEILMAFGKNPWCMTVSEDKITSVMEVFVNKMGLGPSDLADKPFVICLSLEKRIVPRCAVYQCLLDKGLMKKSKDFGFSWWLSCSETIFLNRIKKKYEKESPELLKLYHEKLNLAKC